jgi:hypothetical protein
LRVIVSFLDRPGTPSLNPSAVHQLIRASFVGKNCQTPERKTTWRLGEFFMCIPIQIPNKQEHRIPANFFNNEIMHSIILPNRPKEIFAKEGLSHADFRRRNQLKTRIWASMLSFFDSAASRSTSGAAPPGGAAWAGDDW